MSSSGSSTTLLQVKETQGSSLVDPCSVKQVQVGEKHGLSGSASKRLLD